ncbi:hypothetical protein [Micromonospora sp. NPDC047134]|uniref:hypothetical protein n=1 Tax=Micromonospora sp. NPDC047134 TaxID=3154340 RepID=UPI0033C13AE7
MSLTPGLFSEIVTAALAGPLVVAGLAKLLAAPAALQWPIGGGPLRAPHGPRLVGAAECAVVAVAVAAPGRAAALLVMITYAGLAAVAHVLRGQRCACFGLARLASVSRAHVGANALAAVCALAAVTFAAPQGHAGLRATVAVVTALATFGVLRLTDSRRSGVTEEGAACTEQITAVHLYLGDTCPSCRSLKELLAAMEPARREAVSSTVLTREDNLPDMMAGLGVPCAVGLNAAGDPVCRPVDGIGPVKALVDSIVLGVPAAVADAR